MNAVTTATAICAPQQPRASNAIKLTVAQFSRAISRLLWLLVVARNLGPSEFGVYTLLFTMSEIVALVSGVGYGDYLTRESTKNHTLGWHLGIRLTWLRLLYIVPMTAFELAVIWLAKYPHVAFAGAIWMTLTFPPRCLTESIEGVLRGVESYTRYLILEMALGLSLVLSGGALWFWQGGLSFAIGGEIVSSLCPGLVALGFVLQKKMQRIVLPSWSELIKRSAVFNVYPVVSNLFDRVDVLLLAKLAGSYATGVYSAAYRPLGAAQLLPYGVLYSLLPSLSRRLGHNEVIRLERAMGLLFSAALLVVLVTTIFGGYAVHLLLGTHYAESALALKILIWAVIVRYLNYSLNMLLLAAGKERVFVVTSLICLAANAIANLIFIPLFSWRAAAIVTIATELLLMLQNAYWLRRTTGRVPKPVGWLRTTFVFGALLFVSLIGAKVVSPILIGSACVLFFLAYLYRTGMTGQFAAAWGAERHSAWEASSP